MSKIIILTDSCCDLPKETIEELGIKVLPFTLTVGGESFREIFDKSTQEVYELMARTDEIPKHSQISPVTFEETYKELYDQGYTDIISVSIRAPAHTTTPFSQRTTSLRTIRRPERRYVFSTLTPSATQFSTATP